MKMLLLTLLLMISSGYVLAANQDADEVRLECTQMGKDEGLSGDELAEYVAACVEDKTTSKN